MSDTEAPPRLNPWFDQNARVHYRTVDMMSGYERRGYGTVTSNYHVDGDPTRYGAKIRTDFGTVLDVERAAFGDEPLAESHIELAPEGARDYDASVYAAAAPDA